MQLPLEIYEWLVSSGIVSNTGTLEITQESKTRKAVSLSHRGPPPTLIMDSSLEK
jgi:hypothetical protein